MFEILRCLITFNAQQYIGLQATYDLFCVLFAAPHPLGTISSFFRWVTFCYAGYILVLYLLLTWQFTLVPLYHFLLSFRLYCHLMTTKFKVHSGVRNWKAKFGRDVIISRTSLLTVNVTPQPSKRNWR